MHLLYRTELYQNILRIAPFNVGEKMATNNLMIKSTLACSQTKTDMVLVIF